ncbi:MAG TPA: hypothetical protein VHR47_04465 [Bacillota bacterium]|nr:hypothetical protein [Bacillota bacterium]
MRLLENQPSISKIKGFNRLKNLPRRTVRWVITIPKGVITLDFTVLFIALFLLVVLIHKIRPAYRIITQKAFFGETVIVFGSRFNLGWLIFIAFLIWCCYIAKTHLDMFNFNNLDDFNFIIVILTLLVDLYYSLQKKSLWTQGILDPATGVWFWNEIEAYTIERQEANAKWRKNKLTITVPSRSIWNKGKEATFYFDDNKLLKVKEVLNDRLAGKAVSPVNKISV